MAALAGVRSCDHEIGAQAQEGSRGRGLLSITRTLGACLSQAELHRGRCVCSQKRDTLRGGHASLLSLLPPATGNVALPTSFIVKRTHVMESPTRNRIGPGRQAAEVLVVYSISAKECLLADLCPSLKTL